MSDTTSNAAAEIAARTAEIQARHPHLTQPGQLAASLRAGLAEIRGTAVEATAQCRQPSQHPDTAAALIQCNIPAHWSPAAEDETRPPVEIDLAGLPDAQREEIEDAAEDVALAADRAESARDDLDAARRALADAQTALEIAHDTYDRTCRDADHAQTRQSGILRAYGLVITHNGYARRPM